MWEGNGGMGEWGMRNENLEKGQSVNRGMNIQKRRNLEIGEWKSRKEE